MHLLRSLKQPEHDEDVSGNFLALMPVHTYYTNYLLSKFDCKLIFTLSRKHRSTHISINIMILNFLWSVFVRSFHI